MTNSELLREARKQVAFSYTHKFLLLAVAFGGFWALHWLIEQKKEFDKPNWMVTGGIAEVVSKATQDPYCVTPEKEKKRFATLEALTSAMQDRAEACVREGIRDNVNEARREMAQIGERDPLTQERAPLTEEELKTYTRYASLIAREEAFADLKVRAVRQYIGAMLLSMPDNQKNEAGIRRILDETSGGYVIYQILWYASLLLGVGAASMLFIVVLTALPITNGEGYWTERIGEILKSLPTNTNRSIAGPLLATAVGVGTLAGTVAATEAGGQARFPSGPEISIEAPVPPREEPPAGKKSKGSPPDETPGMIYNDYRGPREIELLLTLLMDTPDDPVGLKGIEEDIDLIRQKAGELVTQTETARQNVVDAINNASSKIDGVERAARDAEARIVDIENIVSVTNQTAGAIFADVQDLKPVVTQVEQVSKTLGRHVIDETKIGKGIEGREEDQAKTVTQTLAQDAEADPRGFFGRTFGRTLFKVGPAVPKMMSARLDTTSASKDEKKVFLKVIEDMREEKLRLYSTEFKHELLDRLKKPVEGTTLTEDQIDSLMNGHLRALLRICALPR